MSNTMIRKELEAIKSKIEKLLQTIDKEDSPSSTPKENSSSSTKTPVMRVNLWFKDIFINNEKGIRDVILGKSYNADIWKYPPVKMESFSGKNFKVEKDLKVIATSIFNDHNKTKDEKKYMKNFMEQHIQSRKYAVQPLQN